MIHKEGKNYHFFFATPNSVARIQSLSEPFYNFPKSKIPELPSLHSEPILIPKFLYSLHWNRTRFPSVSIDTFDYNHPKPETGEIQIGGMIHQESIHLTKTKRTKYGQNKYLSLRDIVNPNFSEEEVNEKIEMLYFDKKSKNFLFRLVRILYSGTPEEEYKIVSNLFTHESEFAKFLSNSMFTAEIIPLIHGPFVQSFISSFDERIVKFELPKLSKPVREVLQKSVSKNKFQMIQNSPALEPKEGEGLIETMETEVYRRFSRNIYFEEGNMFTYKVSSDEENPDSVRTNFENADKFRFWRSDPYIEFYGCSKTKLFFQTKEWIDVLRFDWFLSRKDFESYEFHRLPPYHLIEIPFFTTGLAIVGGGITKERRGFEFTLQWFDY
ncbi:flagellar motor switch protein FliG [Leptospira ilyithenensis]|uniref:Flagellar motor switch protein FliG n=1 Tax=Leptospira ilyithenensis TaxID=2484901 RepID=A0A4R9LSC6_9LEPT|nr:flagellar motor switch protein FliG [Leptospira ilyithenensis]TGN11903.1 flagellar motor switch protein FliG [Leptospira ilyithenensis]